MSFLELGGFRKAFKASGSREFKGSTWVIKRYLENTNKDILELGQSLEEHTKKEGQMHYLARNFTAKFKEEPIAQELIAPELQGEFFRA